MDQRKRIEKNGMLKYKGYRNEGPFRASVKCLSIFQYLLDK